MRVIAASTLKKYWKKFPAGKHSILAWYEEAEAAEWKNPNELKAQHRNASVITSKRVVFNIHRNKFRLVVDIEFKMQIAIIVWFGTHQQYDKIDVKQIRYDKTH